MKHFADLYTALDATTKTSEKVSVIRDYLAIADASDAAWAIYFLSGGKLSRLVTTRLLRQWAAEVAEIPLWLLEESYHAVGDLAETLTLIVPDGQQCNVGSLTDWIENRLHPLKSMPENEQRAAVKAMWQQTESTVRFVLMKLMTGNFRVGVSRRLVSRAIADHASIPIDVVSHRLMGNWQPTSTGYERLIDPAVQDVRASQPYPFCLAHPIDGEIGPESLGDARSFVAEWKWDGIRGQVIRREGQTFIWSRGEDLMENRWPEIESAADLLPDGTVIDGEILAAIPGGEVLPFASLQRRIGRKRVGKKLLAEVPVVFHAFDLVEHQAKDSGHQPTAISRLIFVPTNSLELIEFSAAQDAIARGDLESRLLLKKPLDVLAQHVVTIAIGGGFRSEELLAEVRSTAAYQSLSDAEWQWILNFVMHGGNSLAAYPEFQRVTMEGGRYLVTNRRTTQMHRMNIGTIASDASMTVRFLKGTTLGTAEESFLSKLNIGDRFLFAGRLVSLVLVRDNVAYVRKATGTPDTIPRWMGGRMPLSSELSAALRLRIEQAAAGQLIGREMKSLKRLFDIQQRWSQLPRRDELLIEQIQTRGSHQIFVFPFEGRLVHEGIAALVAYRLSQRQKTTFSIGCNDYGFVLQSPHRVDVPQAIEQGLFVNESLVPDILSSMNSTQMAKRQFRQIARVAGLIQAGYPGQRKSASNIQASSNLFFEVFCQYDPQNFLLEQSRREVLQMQLEIQRISTALDRIQNSKIIVTSPPKTTPLAFPLLVDKLRESLSSESLSDRIARLQQQLEKAADQSTELAR